MRINAIAVLALSAISVSPVEAGEEWGRNPFAFGRANATATGNGTAHAKSSGPSLCVEMVIIHEGKTMAVVNGRTVAVNDIVNGAVVTVISMDSVSFAKNGKTLVRRVGDDSDEAH